MLFGSPGGMGSPTRVSSSTYANSVLAFMRVNRTSTPRAGKRFETRSPPASCWRAFLSGRRASEPAERSHRPQPDSDGPVAAGYRRGWDTTEGASARTHARDNVLLGRCSFGMLDFGDWLRTPWRRSNRETCGERGNSYATSPTAGAAKQFIGSSSTESRPNLTRRPSCYSTCSSRRTRPQSRGSATTEKARWRSGESADQG